MGKINAHRASHRPPLRRACSLRSIKSSKRARSCSRSSWAIRRSIGIGIKPDWLVRNSLDFLLGKWGSAGESWRMARTFHAAYVPWLILRGWDRRVARRMGDNAPPCALQICCGKVVVWAHTTLHPARYKLRGIGWNRQPAPASSRKSPEGDKS